MRFHLHKELSRRQERIVQQYPTTWQALGKLGLLLAVVVGAIIGWAVIIAEIIRLVWALFGTNL